MTTGSAPVLLQTGTAVAATNEVAWAGRTHSPIGEPLSLALENVAILWWATPPEN